MNDLEHALSAYENALRHNPMSMSGLTQVAGIARIKENYPKVCSIYCMVFLASFSNCNRMLMAKVFGKVVRLPMSPGLPRSKIGPYFLDLRSATCS